MFEDDQETPNTLNATFCFDAPGGKRKMLELEVRHWITNHELEIGTGAYGASGVPPAGLTADTKKNPDSKQSWGQKMPRRTPLATFFMDQTATSPSTVTTPTRRG